MQKNNALPTMYTCIRFKTGQCVVCDLTLAAYAELECWYLVTPVYIKHRKLFKNASNGGTKFRLLDARSRRRYIFERDSISTIDAKIRFPDTSSITMNRRDVE